ncbi:MAG: RluA family pseudouridine synthase [Pirellulaceae bacterium]
MTQLRVLYEDNHLLVVDKVAGIATMGTASDVPTVARQAAQYLKQKYNKPGNVFVGVVSRLDSLVTGVLILARTSKAASRLSAQIRQQLPQKRYLALVEGVLPNKMGPWWQLDDWVAKHEGQHRMQIVPKGYQSAQLASLRVRTLAVGARASMVEIELLTGRKHQIRLQLSAAGCPVLGDRKYESTRMFPAGIALHCARVKIEHPTLRATMTFTSLPDEAWLCPTGMPPRRNDNRSSGKREITRLVEQGVAKWQQECRNEG